MFYRNYKCLAHISIVKPLLEYGSAVWDPYSYLQKDIQSIEMVQRRAARCSNQIIDVTVVLHLC